MNDDSTTVIVFQWLSLSTYGCLALTQPSYMSKLPMGFTKGLQSRYAFRSRHLHQGAALCSRRLTQWQGRCTLVPRFEDLGVAAAQLLWHQICCGTVLHRQHRTPRTQGYMTRTPYPER
ncbi:hypothetical protein PLICRDRAFT_554169 [Plicaturopsis crispa FD-325 SS-3]|nr:hypothetical protein PLICRDRAFT_554169 [Plicaturopsis crispa FD-325 SS-3]